MAQAQLAPALSFANQEVQRLFGQPPLAQQAIGADEVADAEELDVKVKALRGEEWTPPWTTLRYGSFVLRARYID